MKVATVKVLANNGSHNGETIDNAEYWLLPLSTSSALTYTTNAGLIGNLVKYGDSQVISFKGTNYNVSGGITRTTQGFRMYPFYPGDIGSATTKRLRNETTYSLIPVQYTPVHLKR